MIFGFMVILNLTLLMLSITLALIYHTLENFTQRNIADRGLRAFYALNRDVHEFVNPSAALLCRLFDKLVSSVILYASETWGFHVSLAVEKVQLKFCKWLLKVPNCTTNEMVYGELGRFPMLINRKIRILKYWVKIVNGKACPLVKQMYNVLYCVTLSDKRVINSASLVKSLIISLGFGLVWTEQFVANEFYFITLCKQRLCDQYIQQWFGIISQMSSCMLYNDLHVSFFF